MGGLSCLPRQDSCCLSAAAKEGTEEKVCKLQEKEEECALETETNKKMERKRRKQRRGRQRKEAMEDEVKLEEAWKEEGAEVED